MLAIAGLAVAVYLHWCRSDEHEPVRQTPARTESGLRSSATPSGSGDPNRVDRVILRAALARLRKLDIPVGELKLAGKAVDEKNQPIAGATITLAGTRTTTSEQDGSFAFDELAAGDYELAGERDKLYGEDSVTLTDTSDPEVLTLRFGPTLVVHVVDHAGTPQLGVKLEPRKANARLSDAEGKVTFRGLGLGDETVEISKSGFATQRVRIDLGDDATRTIDRRVVLAPSAPIGGVVIDEDGKPVAGAHVSASTSPRGWTDGSDADESGRWKLDSFGAGKVVLTAWNDTEVATPPTPISLDGTTPRLDLVVHVVRGATVGGLVTDAAGKPLAEVHVSVGASVADSDEHGRFVIGGLDPGDFDVTAATDTLGAVGQHITLGYGEHKELKLAMVASTISGTITNGHGAPVADATVIATAAGSGIGRGFTRSDELGHFDFGGLPPGDYELNATRAEEPTSAAPDIPARTGQHDVALVIPDEAKLTGRIVMNGQPVEFFGVVAKPSNEKSHGVPDPVRATDGRFTIDDLRPGTFDLAIVGPTFTVTEVKDIAISASGTIDLGDIEVQPGKRLRGRVVDANGDPVASVGVVVEHGSNIDADVSLHNALYGAQTTYTDATGHFEIAGLSDTAQDPDDGPDDLWVQAHGETAVATPRRIEPGDFDTEITLTLVATGSISGTVANMKSGDTFLAHATGSDGREYTDTTNDGSFSIEALPPGDYAVTLDSDLVVPPATVHVASGVVAQVSFTRPDTLGTVDVTIENGECLGISVEATTGANLSFGRCTDDHHARVEHLGAGSFKLCNESCATVDVPATTAVTIVEATPTDDAPSPSPSQADPSPTPDPEPEADPPAEADEEAPTAD